MDWTDDLKIGDKVRIYTNNTYRFVEVVRLTQSMIVDSEGNKWGRKTHRRRGEEDYTGRWGQEYSSISEYRVSDEPDFVECNALIDGLQQQIYTMPVGRVRDVLAALKRLGIQPGRQRN